MDLRQDIIRVVMEQLHGRLTGDQISLVQDVLVLALDRYEVQERCTEVSVCAHSSEELLRRFVATKRVEGIAETTLRRYVYVNQRMMNFIGKPIEEITTYDLRFYLSHKRQTDGVSNRTLDGMRRCFSSFFGWLSDEGVIDRNPCGMLKQIKSRQSIKKPFTAEEVERIRKACTEQRDLALVDFLYSTGCRVSELTALNISDIDFATHECIVIGKGNKERTVYLSDVAMLNLREYLLGRADGNPALFIGRGGDRLGKNGIEALLRRLGKTAGVDDVHPHRYRRTLATNLLDRGMPMQDVAAILGHADLKTTQIYCYISQSNVRQAYFKLVS